MIDRCLNLVQMGEVYFNEKKALEGIYLAFCFTAISVLTNIVFIFVQSFFIFKYANIIINRGKNVSVIAIMHIISTNVCIAFRTIIKETVSEIIEYNENHKMDSNGRIGSLKKHHGQFCEVPNYTFDMFVCL